MKLRRLVQEQKRRSKNMWEMYKNQRNGKEIKERNS